MNNPDHDYWINVSLARYASSSPYILKTEAVPDLQGAQEQEADRALPLQGTRVTQSRLILSFFHVYFENIIENKENAEHHIDQFQEGSYRKYSPLVPHSPGSKSGLPRSTTASNWSSFSWSRTPTRWTRSSSIQYGGLVALV